MNCFNYEKYVSSKVNAFGYIANKYFKRRTNKSIFIKIKNQLCAACESSYSS